MKYRLLTGIAMTLGCLCVGIIWAVDLLMKAEAKAEKAARWCRARARLIVLTVRQ
jgi:hypothetical protein